MKSRSQILVHSLLCGVFALSMGCASAAKEITAPAEKASHGMRGQVMTGADVLAADDFAMLAGKRVGLITNHTGMLRDGTSLIDAMHASKNVKLVALFSPEHGIRGTEDEKVASTTDEKTGLPVNSLYGKTQKPSAEMLKDVDVLVFDIQDIGTRFYTYIGTMAKAMESAKENGKKFVVLDRPNVIGGLHVEGAVPPKEQTGVNTSIFPIPTRHGMTVGELATLFNTDFAIGCDLEVVQMKNWSRGMYFDETGLLWKNPSPNMKTVNGAILYPGPGSLETTSISPARGTERPFEMYGAPYMDGLALANEMNSRNIPGIRWATVDFTPTAQYHKFKGELCHGVYGIIYDRDALDSVGAGLHLAQAMQKLYPEKFTADGGFKGETGSPLTWEQLKTMTPEQIENSWKPELDKFMAMRKKCLLY
ncbi:DUF1343 domain-containing protein [soil metagenome]